MALSNNEFNYEQQCVDQAISDIQAAIENCESASSIVMDLTNLCASLPPSIQIAGIGSIMGMLNGPLTRLKSLNNKIKDWQIMIIRQLITEGRFKNDGINEFIESSNMTEEQIVIFGVLYCEAICGLDGGLTNLNNLKTNITNPRDALIEAGLSKEVVDRLDDAFVTVLADNDMMYTGTGMAYAHNAITGLLAMFGYKMPYAWTNNSYVSDDEFFIGTEETPLNGTVCTSYVHWLFRCVGIDLPANADGAAPCDFLIRYAATYDENGKLVFNTYYPKDYSNDSESGYTSCKAGDVLFNGGHMMVILENTGDGYVVAQNGGARPTAFFTYEDLVNAQYSVTDMSAVFNGTSVALTEPSLHQYVSDVPKEGRYGTGIMIPPNLYGEKFDLSEETMEKIKEQYSNGYGNSEHTEYTMGVDFGNTSSEPIGPPESHVTAPPPSESENPETSIIRENNIFPENEFSYVLPPLSTGSLGNMEISRTTVLYEILGINDNTYNDYVKSLIDSGFELMPSGEFKKDMYSISIIRDPENTTLTIGLTLLPTN